MKFKIGNKVKVIADNERLMENQINTETVSSGMIGTIIKIRPDDNREDPLDYKVAFGDNRWWWFGETDLELVDGIRTFEGGATRDTDQGKLDYVRALSPIVLKRYVEYLNKHRTLPDGSLRGFDNWKQSIPQETYHSSGGRHFIDTWLITEGYLAEDNHGPVELEDALCAQIFNAMGRLHEVLRNRGYCMPIDRDKPVPGGY